MSSSRVLAAVLSAVFVFFGNETALGTAHCPHHDPGRQAHHPSHRPAPEAPCTCVGTCHASAATPLVIAPGPVLRLRGAPCPLAARSAVLSPPRAAAPYLLPYPNPPLSGVAVSEIR